VATKNQIIEEFYCGKEFNDCIGKMEPEHLRDDLRAEVALILLETDTDKLLAIHDAGALKYYAVRIIMNLIQSKTSKFYKQYRQQLVELTDRFMAEEEPDFEERGNREDMEEQAMKEIDNLYWYNAGIIKLYMKHGNYRAIQEDTGIPYSSAYKTIQKSFQEIKQKVLR
jgi:DNA-directed RNA polymerase specialized sigma24 family protein